MSLDSRNFYLSLIPEGRSIGTTNGAKAAVKLNFYLFYFHSSYAIFSELKIPLFTASQALTPLTLTTPLDFTSNPKVLPIGITVGHEMIISDLDFFWSPLWRFCAGLLSSEHWQDEIHLAPSWLPSTFSFYLDILYQTTTYRRIRQQTNFDFLGRLLTTYLYLILSHTSYPVSPYPCSWTLT